MIDQIQFNLLSIHQGHLGVQYKGIPALKCPFDYVLYQMLFNEVRPDLIIEVGAYVGGGSLYYADLMRNLGIDGQVHAIDIEDRFPDQVKNDPKIKLFLDGWKNYPLEITKNFDRVLVIEDSSHTAQNTLDVLRHFSPCVTKGSYLIVEDGIITALTQLGRYAESDFSGGPELAIRTFLDESSDQFSIDRKYCDFFGTNATWNTNGYLKKIG